MALIVGLIPLIAAVTGAFINKYNDLKFKKFEYKAELYLEYLSVVVIQKEETVQKELVYKLMIVGGKKVAKVLKENRFVQPDSNPERGAILNKKLLKAMRSEFHGKCGTKVLESFPLNAFR